jgi:hypothetical protein
MRDGLVIRPRGPVARETHQHLVRALHHLHPATLQGAGNGTPGKRAKALRFLNLCGTCSGSCGDTRLRQPVPAPREAATTRRETGCSLENETVVESWATR